MKLLRESGFSSLPVVGSSETPLISPKDSRFWDEVRQLQKPDSTTAMQQYVFRNRHMPDSAHSIILGRCSNGMPMWQGVLDKAANVLLIGKDSRSALAGIVYGVQLGGMKQWKTVIYTASAGDWYREDHGFTIEVVDMSDLDMIQSNIARLAGDLNYLEKKKGPVVSAVTPAEHIVVLDNLVGRFNIPLMQKPDPGVVLISSILQEPQCIPAGVCPVRQIADPFIFAVHTAPRLTDGGMVVPFRIYPAG